jgi:hypothetical protein
MSDSKKPRIRGNSAMLEMVRGSSQLPDSALETITLERDDDRPLRFSGRLIGANDIDEGVTNGTKVAIYVTKSGKIVTGVHQWQREKGRERHAASAHQMPDSALEWLRVDGGGYLGKASKEAWDEACANHLPLQGQDVEVID